MSRRKGRGVSSPDLRAAKRRSEQLNTYLINQDGVTGKRLFGNRHARRKAARILQAMGKDDGR